MLIGTAVGMLPFVSTFFQVILTSVTGGAAIAASPNNSVTVVIADNDLAAGVVALAPSSMAAVVNEGNQHGNYL